VKPVFLGGGLRRWGWRDVVGVEFLERPRGSLVSVACTSRFEGFCLSVLIQYVLSLSVRLVWALTFGFIWLVFGSNVLKDFYQLASTWMLSGCGQRNFRRRRRYPPYTFFYHVEAHFAVEAVWTSSSECSR